MKKLILAILIFFLFSLSYYLKNFPLLLLSISFLTLFGFFYKKINKNFLLILFSFFITITFIEMTLLYSAKGYVVKSKSKEDFSTNIKYEKSFLGYQPSKGVQNYKIVSNGKIIVDKYYSIGNDNFRITPQINNKKKDKTLNFFGGSFTFGYGLNDNQTLPYHTQHYLENWNIKNYGINGYGVHQMLAQILENPEIIKDVNILITDSGHIPRTSCLRHFSFGTPKFILNENKQVIRSGYCNFGIADDIPLPRIVGSIINRSMIKNKIHGLFKKKKYYDEDSVELYLSIIILQKISKLGNMGDTVQVKQGFGRNFLIPSGMALRATKEYKEFFDKTKTFYKYY